VNSRSSSEDARPGTLPRFTPRGPFQVRNYDDARPAEIVPVFALVNALVEEYHVRVSGSMARLMRQWRDDLKKGIEVARVGDRN
jgi:hypothetical protein